MISSGTTERHDPARDSDVNEHGQSAPWFSTFPVTTSFTILYPLSLFLSFVGHRKSTANALGSANNPIHHEFSIHNFVLVWHGAYHLHTKAECTSSTGHCQNQQHSYIIHLSDTHRVIPLSSAVLTSSASFQRVSFCDPDYPSPPHYFVACCCLPVLSLE
ncbi:hypothetical protein BDN72DRAFT_522052 [Pluteus cervinus]|uniref:Uncharacterized protein n=1 Tax=Pluteus cervinus TaxID=181527 RepID=A0ACD3AZL2_9AGAR|nr:hypothetical protein BDN72DRAFT_522052 [Pluteus cervinus]